MTTRLRYGTAAAPDAALVHLVANAGTAEEAPVPFSGRLEIGRDELGLEALRGLLLVSDPWVSHRHCIIEGPTDGRWYIRDVSRSRTRVAGRRLVPNVESEVGPGETLSTGSHDFKLDTRAPAAEPVRHTCARDTDAAPTETIARRSP